MGPPDLGRLQDRRRLPDPERHLEVLARRVAVEPLVERVGAHEVGPVGGRARPERRDADRSPRLGDVAHVPGAPQRHRLA